MYRYITNPVAILHIIYSSKFIHDLTIDYLKSSQNIPNQNPTFSRSPLSTAYNNLLFSSLPSWIPIVKIFKGEGELGPPSFVRISTLFGHGSPAIFMEAIKFAGTHDILEASNRKRERWKIASKRKEDRDGGAWEGHAHI